MKKKVIIALMWALVAAYGFSEEKSPLFSRWGLMFDIRSLLFDVEPYNDGYMAGAGTKFVFSRIPVAARMLVNYQHWQEEIAGDDYSRNYFGISLGGEYHLTKTKASPYIGGLIGTRGYREQVPAGQDDPGWQFDFYFGPVVGGELKLLENLSLYCEYNLIFAIDGNGFHVNTDVNSANTGPTPPAPPASMVQAGITLYF